MNIVRYLDINTKLTKKVDHILKLLYSIKFNNNIY